MSMSSGRRRCSVTCTAPARFCTASSSDCVASCLMRTITIPYGARWINAVRVSIMVAPDHTAAVARAALALWLRQVRSEVGGLGGEILRSQADVDAQRPGVHLPALQAAHVVDPPR